ncbi:MAG: glutaredoxin family protein [Gallionella sp.]|nr:glutaredoxin family protein [Gallionella sp.]
MKHIGLLLVCLAIMPLGVRAGEIYRWVEPSGIVHYSDVPNADAERIDTKKSSEADTPGENLPYETLRAQQNFPVTFYVGPGCGETCNQARSLLSKRGIPFTEKSLKTREDVEAFKQLSGIDGVPVLSVGKTYLRGFLAEQWHNELDIAGYPKTPPYRAPGMPSTTDAASRDVPANTAEQ